MNPTRRLGSPVCEAGARLRGEPRKFFAGPLLGDHLAALFSLFFGHFYVILILLQVGYTGSLVQAPLHTVEEKMLLGCEEIELDPPTPQC